MCVLFYHRGVWVCGRDGSTPLYRVCFSGIANTQALLTYLNFNMTDLYYSRISRCRPPPSPLFKFSIPWGRDFALLFRVYYPSLICEPVFFSFFSLKLPFFSTLFTCCQGSRFSQFVSVFSTFELFVPLKSKFQKKSARPRGPLPQAPAPSRSAIRCNSVPCGNREASPDTPECAGLWQWPPAFFLGIGPLYRASWSFSWHFFF